MVECDTLSSSLKELNINTLDYLKIDTQGAELEILKGLENYRPLIIKCEVQIFPMYKKEPAWTEVTDLLYKLGYIIYVIENVSCVKILSHHISSQIKKYLYYYTFEYQVACSCYRNILYYAYLLQLLQHIQFFLL